MKFCPVVPEICRGQVHGPRKERRKRIRRIRIINNKNKNNNKKRSKNNKSAKLCLGDLIIRNGAKIMSPKLCLGDLIIFQGKHFNYFIVVGGWRHIFEEINMYIIVYTCTTHVI
jgi:hypothetical protein